MSYEMIGHSPHCIMQYLIIYNSMYRMSLHTGTRYIIIMYWTCHRPYNSVCAYHTSHIRGHVP